MIWEWKCAWDEVVFGHVIGMNLHVPQITQQHCKSQEHIGCPYVRQQKMVIPDGKLGHKQKMQLGFICAWHSACVALMCSFEKQSLPVSPGSVRNYRHLYSSTIVWFLLLHCQHAWLLAEDRTDSRERQGAWVSMWRKQGTKTEPADLLAASCAGAFNKVYK